jgi:hypothetical protein
LSIAQFDFFEQEIEKHAALGDCRMDGRRLTMDDYEGANATLQSFAYKSTPTTRAYITRESVASRLNAAIVRAHSGRAA